MSIKIRDVSLSKPDIDFIYNLYIDAIIELAKVKPIIEVSIFDKSPFNPKSDILNPYIKGDWLDKLGASVIKNGTHWVYIVRHRAFLSGNHRIMSLRKLAEDGLISKNHKVLCVDIGIDSTFKYPLTIKTLKAKELDELKEFGLETEKIVCHNYRRWIETILRIPKIMKEVLYKYKQVVGKEYRTYLVINNIEELKRRAK